MFALFLTLKTLADISFCVPTNVRPSKTTKELSKSAFHATVATKIFIIGHTQGNKHHYDTVCIATNGYQRK